VLRRPSALVWLVQGVAVAAWLWPIGFGGKMPVGGDVTQFSIGLMAVLGRALREGHLPVWNDLWGYGFPGVGESQMGVYYPPHWLLYGLLPVEAAYTASLVLHTLWGSFGASWCARKFGASAVGAALAGYSWAACGFFAVHLTHQWGTTTGCWMPWAWGLAWSAFRGETRSAPFWLALVLAVQLLPGHFQLAFCTQVGIVVLALEQTAERFVTRSGSFRFVLATLAAVGAAFFLAAAQVGPTLRLARLAAIRRDFEYLSGFAASPLHLATFFAPGLFERSPLWRPLVWDPFHTSPEEYLGYVGLVPLFLALGAVGTGLKRSPGVRALLTVGLVTTWLSLGPYVPGFRSVCALPGFSFFRAPARWMLAVSLALCLLAGVGFDGLVTWRRPGRALMRFGLSAFLIPALVVVAVEIALAGNSLPAVSSAFARAFDALPWHEPEVFAKVVDKARHPEPDFRVDQTLARQGVRLRDHPRPVFSRERSAIYRQELTGSSLILFGLLLTATLAGRPRRVQGLLVVLTWLDLGFLAYQRRVDYAPIASLTGQSPVLARLAAAPRGSRVVETERVDNLPMLAGAAPVSGYRTLDLPAVLSVNALATQLSGTSTWQTAITEALRFSGASLRVYDPSEVAELSRHGFDPPGVGGVERVRDPALAGWKFGADYVAQRGPAASTFLIARVLDGGVRAWLVPLTPARSAAILSERAGQPQAPEVLAALRGASPLELLRPDPERRELRVVATGPSLVVISELADPQWEAFWSGDGGDRVGEVRRAFGVAGQGAWQAVEVPGAGSWRLRLRYRARDVQLGLTVSALSLVAWAVGLFRFGRERRRSSREAERP
jgi:hypothetical protein